MRKRNFSAKTVTTRTAFIDALSRYTPQPTTRGFLAEKVIIERIPLKRPITKINTVSVKLILTIDGCAVKDVCGRIRYPMMASSERPRPCADN
jgi:hypothetical protein